MTNSAFQFQPQPLHFERWNDAIFAEVIYPQSVYDIIRDSGSGSAEIAGGISASPDGVQQYIAAAPMGMGAAHAVMPVRSLHGPKSDVQMKHS